MLPPEIIEVCGSTHACIFLPSHFICPSGSTLDTLLHALLFHLTLSLDIFQDVWFLQCMDIPWFDGHMCCLISLAITKTAEINNLRAFLCFVFLPWSAVIKHPSPPMQSSHMNGVVWSTMPSSFLSGHWSTLFIFNTVHPRPSAQAGLPLPFHLSTMWITRCLSVHLDSYFSKCLS